MGSFYDSIILLLFEPGQHTEWRRGPSQRGQTPTRTRCVLLSVLHIGSILLFVSTAEAKIRQNLTLKKGTNFDSSPFSSIIHPCRSQENHKTALSAQPVKLSAVSWTLFARLALKVRKQPRMPTGWWMGRERSITTRRNRFWAGKTPTEKEGGIAPPPPLHPRLTVEKVPCCLIKPTLPVLINLCHE